MLHPGPDRRRAIFPLAAYATRAADRAFDQLLLASALSIADALQFEDGEIAVDLPYAALAILATGRRDRIFYRIASPDGTLITGYADLARRFHRPSPPPHGSATSAFATHRCGPPSSGAWSPCPAGAGSPSSWPTSRDERAALASEIFANAFLPVLLLAVVAGGLIWFGVRRALAPLATIERWSVTASRPTSAQSPAPCRSEVRQLLAALNRFMARLQVNLTLDADLSRRRGASDPHPTGDPARASRPRLEEEDPVSLRSYVFKIHRNAALASQVTNQLLSHTMVAHRGQVGAREPVDLVALLRQVAQRAEAGGVSPPIELDLRALDGPALVEGDPIYAA